ncbi:MAG: hypothetical protein HOW97_07010, partial [Catenulispora sp.]|nr:hypothetical protein [Catenulispora sp.]
MPGDHRSLGPQQLTELILNVLVELIDRGVILDPQLLLQLLPVDQRRPTLTCVEATPIGRRRVDLPRTPVETTRLPVTTGPAADSTPRVAVAETTVVARATPRVPVAITPAAPVFEAPVAPTARTRLRAVAVAPRIPVAIAAAPARTAPVTETTVGAATRVPVAEATTAGAARVAVTKTTAITSTGAGPVTMPTAIA